VIGERALSTGQYVPVAPLRKRFLELRDSGMTSPTQIARALGTDERSVSRALGLVKYRASPGVWRHRQYIAAPRAARLVRAMGLDPWEVGL
jgi:hypothetical protein